MPESEYEARKDSVLAWKKEQKLGRFDPNTPDVEQQKIRQLERDVEERGMFDVHEERRFSTSFYLLQLCVVRTIIFSKKKKKKIPLLYAATLHQLDNIYHIENCQLLTLPSLRNRSWPSLPSTSLY